MIKQRRESVPSLRLTNTSVSPDVESIVCQVSRFSPEKRYHSADNLREDLQRHLDDLPLRHAPNVSLRARAANGGAVIRVVTSATSVSMIALVIFSAMATLWMTRGRTIARLEAESTLQTFEQDLSKVRSTA